MKARDLQPRRRAGTACRFCGALAISIVLHAALLLPFPWLLPHPEPLAGQIFLQASLPPPQIPPRVAETPSEPGPAADGDKDPARPPPDDAPKPNRITAAGGETAIATGSAPPREMPKAAPGRTEAMILDQPVPPAYPPEALRRKLEACVLAAVTVSPAGDVTAVRIIRADHPEIFGQSVIDAQMAAHYAPARNGGEAIESQVMTVAAFVLEPGRKLNCALRHADIAERLILGEPVQ